MKCINFGGKELFSSNLGEISDMKYSKPGSVFSDPDSLNPPDLDLRILRTQGPNPDFAKSGSTHLDPDQEICDKNCTKYKEEK